MTLQIPPAKLAEIHAHGESAYPEEGAGFLLGQLRESSRVVEVTLAVTNAREDTARHNRYLITPEDYLHSEQEAARLGLEVLGVFHSHPDHPSQPSEFDRAWALPNLSYVITSVRNGTARESRSWRLAENRERFVEEALAVMDDSAIL